MGVDRSAVEALAYQLWTARGSPHGSHEQDWAEAERQLANGGHSEAASGTDESSEVDESLNESFPASDAPSSHLPDEPPVNAARPKTKTTKAVRRRQPRSTS